MYLVSETLGALDCQKLFPTSKVGKNITVDPHCFPGLDGQEDLEELNADSRAYYVPKRQP